MSKLPSGAIVRQIGPTKTKSNDSQTTKTPFTSKTRPVFFVSKPTKILQRTVSKSSTIANAPQLNDLNNNENDPQPQETDKSTSPSNQPITTNTAISDTNTNKGEVTPSLNSKKRGRPRKPSQSTQSDQSSQGDIISNAANNTQSTVISPTKNSQLHSQEYTVTKDEAPQEEDFELKVLVTKIPLTDLISGQRITYCCRTIRCEHVSCFDFNSFLDIHPNYKVVGFFERINENKENRFSFQELTNDKFKIIKKKGKFSITQRKFTRKTRKSEPFLKCPICSLKFQPNELIFDDFMDIVLAHVPKDVKMVDIDDNWIVTPVREESPYKENEVVCLDDDNDDDEYNSDNLIVTKRKKVRFIDSADGETDDYEKISDSFVQKVDSESDGDFNGDSFSDSGASIDLDDFDDLFNEENLGTENDPVIID